MTIDSYRSLEEFLAAPVEEVAKVAPNTLIFSAGGTRRSAVFAGISPVSYEYIRWSRKKMITSFDIIFQHGVRHIFAAVVIPNQFKEVTKGYRDNLVDNYVNIVDNFISGPEALADYVRLGWRVRLVGAESLPGLSPTNKRLQKATLLQSNATVWLVMVPKDDSPWEELLAAVHRKQVWTRKEAIRALYGEDIPPATLFLSFGKPQVFPAIVPPLLVGNLQCYWKQQPGYDLDQDTFRTILYDYAYVRRTWSANKSGRSEKALKNRAAWERGPTIGLGMRLGPFWYPAPISLPSEEQA